MTCAWTIAIGRSLGRHDTLSGCTRTVEIEEQAAAHVTNAAISDPHEAKTCAQANTAIERQR